MPEFILFPAFVLAAVVTTGALLDRKRVRRSRRLLVWVGLFLMLPFFLFAFFLYMLFRDGWHYC
jgi:quinol-cytochrome oxidoreductase complex cytochrome b subunit